MVGVYTAYLVGLIIAFVGLITMNKAQPALLYLCPLLLITSLLVALARKEFKRFWTGEPVKFNPFQLNLIIFLICKIKKKKDSQVD